MQESEAYLLNYKRFKFVKLDEGRRRENYISNGEEM